MGSRYKPEKDGVCYHIMTRTAQLKYWLKDEQEVKRYWINLIHFYARVFYVEVLAYTILSNHYHLCLRVRKPDFDPQNVRARHKIAQSRVKNPRHLQPQMEEAYHRKLSDISTYMAIVNQRTSLFHNRLKGTKGHFWGDRFKSKVIDAESYLLNVLTYIELNSVRAGLVTDAENFYFSSIARIKNAIDKKQYDPTPRVGCLRKLPDYQRGYTYIHLVKFLNQKIKGGKSHRSAMNRFIQDLVGKREIRQMLLTIENRVASDWAKQTFSESIKRRCGPMIKK